MGSRKSGRMKVPIMILLTSLQKICLSQDDSACASNSSLSGCSNLVLSSSGLGGAVILPENSIRARGTREKLFRRYYYLQYLKIVFAELKREYARAYYQSPNGLFDYEDELDLAFSLG